MMFSPFLSKIVSASSAVHCYAYREKETKETIECTGALRNEVCLYEENWLGTVGFHSGPRPLCELYLLLTWINELTLYTPYGMLVAPKSFAHTSQKSSEI